MGLRVDSTIKLIILKRELEKKSEPHFVYWNATSQLRSTSINHVNNLLHSNDGMEIWRSHLLISKDLQPPIWLYHHPFA